MVVSASLAERGGRHPCRPDKMMELPTPGKSVGCPRNGVSPFPPGWKPGSPAGRMPAATEKQIGAPAGAPCIGLMVKGGPATSPREDHRHRVAHLAHFLVGDEAAHRILAAFRHIRLRQRRRVRIRRSDDPLSPASIAPCPPAGCRDSPRSPPAVSRGSAPRPASPWPSTTA